MIMNKLQILTSYEQCNRFHYIPVGFHIESWFRVCLRGSLVRRYLFTVQHTTHPRVAAEGRQTGRSGLCIIHTGNSRPSQTEPSQRACVVCRVYAGQSRDRLVCRSVVGQSHSYRAASCCSRARVRKNKESPGNVASQKSILVHRLLRRSFETSV